MNIVQFGGDKMNKVVTSKEAILDVSRNIAAVSYTHLKGTILWTVAAVIVSLTIASFQFF